MVFKKRNWLTVFLKNQTLDLVKLRDDLRPFLATYKLPTVLRVAPNLPKTPTGKVAKNVLRDQFFPPGGHEDVQILGTGIKSKI